MCEVDTSLTLVGLAGSELLDAGRAAGLRVAGEAFADRAYAPDGTLVQRGTPGALLDVAAAVAQVRQLLETATVCTIDGTVRTVQAETICLHGDSPHALELAQALRKLFPR